MKEEMVFRAWDSGYGSVGVSIEDAEGDVVWSGYISPQYDASNDVIDWYATDWPMQTDGYFIHQAIDDEGDPLVKSAMRSVYKHLWLPHEIVKDLHDRIEAANGTVFEVDVDEAPAST